MLRILLNFLIACVAAGNIVDIHAEPVSAADIVGTLTVHSDIEGQPSSSLLLNLRGHSWLSFDSIGGKTSWTVGTWDEGIHVVNRISKKGVNFDLETDRHPGAYRRTLVTRDQYEKLVTSIKRNDEWTPVRNCSFFASTVWNEVTGEKLSNWSETQDNEMRELFLGSDLGMSRTVPLPSPSGLFDWIFISNGHHFNNDNNALRMRYEKAGSRLP
jgi:hypothetical protein